MRLHLDTSIQGSHDTAAASQTGSVGGRAAARTGESGGNRDSSSVSNLSAALNDAAAQRHARIAQLTAAVQGGQYHVSSAALSGAIIGHSVS